MAMQNQPKTKTCGRCGKVFQCQAQETQGSCWCSLYPTLHPIKSGEDCMCPDCLAKATSSPLLEEIKKIKALRIASFNPSATEMICSLGLMDLLVGVSHECDFPAGVKTKTVLVKSALDYGAMTLAQVDQAVSQKLSSGQNLYVVEEERIREASPNLIVTQDLCQVCAPSGNEITQVLKTLSPAPEVVWQSPHSLEDVFNDLLALGERTGTRERAEALLKDAHQRIEKIRSLSADLPKVRTFFMEWVDPLYCGGHWVPEMIDRAGGLDPIARPGKDSVRVSWEEVVRHDPECLVVAPCGFETKETLEQAETLKKLPGWSGISAVRNDRVWAVAANSYFARPSLRLVMGLEILAHLFHPKVFSWNGPIKAFARVPLVQNHDHSTFPAR